MHWWTYAIYGVAGVLALQGLFSLMAAHRAAAVRRFFHEELRREAGESNTIQNNESDANQRVPTSKAA